MSRSHRDLNYAGFFTYEKDDSIESLQVAHAVFEGKEYEKLLHLDGAPRISVRRGHSVNCNHVGHDIVRLLDAPGGASLITESLEQHYKLRVAGEDRVAGRSAVELAVLPRDTHRYGHRLFIDAESGILLRSVIYGRENKILERFQYVNLVLDPPLTLAMFKGSEGDYQLHHGDKNESPEQLSWQLGWMPGGFVASGQEHSVSRGDMISYTDGLATFSVFVEPLIDQQAKKNRSVEGEARRGATVAYSLAKLLQGAPHRVTVVGEIPAETAQRIAAAVADN